MYIIIKLAVLTVFGLHLAPSRSLHASTPPLNRTLGEQVSAISLHRPSILRMDEYITCINHPPAFRTHKVSLAMCLPTMANLEARPDFEVNHVYGAHEKEERVNITPGPCIINLFPKSSGGVTAISFLEIVHWTKKVLEKCENKEEGGTHFIGVYWYLEVLGTNQRTFRSGS